MLTRDRSLKLLLIVASLATIASATASPAGAWSGRDKYCDAWNFALDPDCKSAKYAPAPTPVTGATGQTGQTGQTGPTADAFIGDAIWPAPPGGKYATIRANGRTAYAPKNAPPAVKRMFRAANSITKKPYIWGGGHVRWFDRGYDCSGATSFVLRAGGFVSWPMVSGTLANWGARGPGRWVRVYANSEHVFMVIAGLRFDTTPWYPGEKGPRWRATVRSTKGFSLRHPVRY
jgi:hypothetical protein